MSSPLDDLHAMWAELVQTTKGYKQLAQPLPSGHWKNASAIYETLETELAQQPPPPPPPPPAPSGAYMSERLAGALTYPDFWYWSPGVTNTDPLWPKHFAWITDAPSGQGLRVTAPAAKSPGVLADGTVVASSSVSGQLVGLESHVSLGAIPSVHAGWASGDPSGTVGKGKHEETWYRWKQRWPVGYRPTLGTQNSTFEWHFDRGSQAALGAAVSPLLLVEGVGGASSSLGAVAFDTAPSNVGRLLFQFGGGGKTETGIGVRREVLAAGALTLGHWYDFVCHFVFDPDPTVGQCQFWVDGALKVDEYRATSYIRPDGSWGYQEDVGAYNYRHWASWASSVDYDELTWGPTLASVGG